MADANEEVSDPQITFKVKTSGDGNHTITMAETATVLDLKTKLAGEDLENIPVDRQRLIYSGRVMKNDDALSTYKIKSGNTIHLVKSAPSNRPAPASSSSSGAAATPAIPTSMAAGTSANNPLAGLTGARYAGQVNLPSADMFGPDGGMHPMPTEEQMAEMLSNPALAQSMNEALNNPQFVDFMIQSNPMLRNMPNAREVLQSPQFRSMMTDPESLRMAARMRRMMQGGGGGGSAFPAPGATDTTPAGAAASGMEGAGAANPAAQQPPMGGQFGGMFPMLMPPGMQGTNPFSALFAPPAAGAQGQQQQQPQQQQTQAPRAGAGESTTPAGSPPQQQGGGAAGNNAGVPQDPWASLLGGAPTAAGNTPFGMTPEMVQNFLQVMNSGGPFAGYGGGGAAAASPPPPADTRPPEERYAEQLRQLNDMGFFDFDRNVAALRRSGGSVQGAIEHLLGS